MVRAYHLCGGTKSVCLELWVSIPGYVVLVSAHLRQLLQKILARFLSFGEADRRGGGQIGVADRGFGAGSRGIQRSVREPDARNTLCDAEYFLSPTSPRVCALLHFGGGEDPAGSGRRDSLRPRSL